MAKDHQGWTPDLLKEHVESRLNLIAHDLEGFPEKYATLDDVKLVRGLVEDIRADHVHRREIEELKGEVHEGVGRRMATVIAISVVTTLLGVMFALAWKSQPSHAEIRSQIQTEAPWLSDRPEIEQRLDSLERQMTVVKQQLAAQKAVNQSVQQRLNDVEAQDRFFCRTRAPKLASC